MISYMCVAMLLFVWVLVSCEMSLHGSIKCHEHCSMFVWLYGCMGVCGPVYSVCVGGLSSSVTT